MKKMFKMVFKIAKEEVGPQFLNFVKLEYFCAGMSFEKIEKLKEKSADVEMDQNLSSDYDKFFQDYTRHRISANLRKAVLNIFPFYFVFYTVLLLPMRACREFQEMK